MNAYRPLHRRHRMALAATACVASLALMASVLMLFDQRSALIWAGLDAHHAAQAAACVAAGDAAAQCGEQIAQVASDDAAATSAVRTR